MNSAIPHQYIERATKKVVTEKLAGDGLVRLLYGPLRENARFLFDSFTSARATDLAAIINMDLCRGRFAAQIFAGKCGMDLSECADPPEFYTSARRIFTRRIQYEKLRPMPDDESCLASPADSRMIPGSFSNISHLFIKDKFFSFQEILGPEKEHWLNNFENGDFAVFRLTPEKYHYNHFPVSGMVVDIYEVEGLFHSCNPYAVVAECSPYSKNRRTVTIIETDVEGGSRVGLVAMIEVTALMIGRVTQCYSEEGYANPVSLAPGLFVKRGQPKSLYEPGSSTDVLLFQPGKIRFSPDILENAARSDVSSRFSAGFGQSLVETEVKVREEIARRLRK